MKKSISIVFAVFYLFITTGFTLCAHYCGSKLDGLSIELPTAKEPCCGSENDSKGCCSEKEIHCQVKEIHNTPVAIQIPGESHFNLAAVSLQAILIPSTSETFTYFSLNHSPPDTSPPIHLLNQVFRI